MALTFVPVLLSIIIILSISLNSLVVITMLKFRAKLKFRDMILLSIAFSDLLQGILGYPLEVSSSLQGSWYFGIKTCRITAFFVTWFGLVSISHLVAMSVDRYITICKPFQAQILHKNRIESWYFILPSWIYGLFWAVMPLIGWGRYAPEGVSRCSVEWKAAHLSGSIYIIMLFIFCYILPVIAMINSFVFITFELRRIHRQSASTFGAASISAQRDFRAERKHTRLVTAMILSFLCAWTPYSLFSLLHSFGKATSVPTTIEDLSVLFAKSSCTFNPIIYTYFYKDFRANLRCLVYSWCPCWTELNVVQPETTTNNESRT